MARRRLCGWVQSGPNGFNTSLNLQGVPYGVTSIEYYSSQAKDLGSVDVDAESGNLNSSFYLEGYGLTNTANTTPVLNLLLD